MKGEDIINRILALSLEKHKVQETWDLLQPFLHEPYNIDIMTICKIEVLLDEKILYVPTKQQWRKIKLINLNNLNK